MGKIYSVDRDAIDRVLFQLRASAVALIPPLLLFALVSCVGQPCAAEDRRGISIGISDYPNYPERERLQFATMDANRFAELLKGNLDGDVAGNVPVNALYDENATRVRIWHALDELKKAPVPETVFLFFSGHGELDLAGKLYLMPYDGDKEHLEETAIQFEQLESFLKTIGLKNVVIFLDTCHSGAAVQGKGSESDAFTAKSIAQQISDANDISEGSMIVLTSSATNEQSWEDADHSSGVFTYFLIKGLEREADINKDGKVTAAELKKYLDDEVPRRSNEISTHQQTIIVNADYSADYVLTMPRSTRPSAMPATKTTPYLSLAYIRNLRMTDENLALMLEVGAVISGLGETGVVSDLHAMALERPVRKQASLKLPPKLETATGWTISSDGSLLFGCADPWNVLEFDLRTGQLSGKLDLPHGSAPRVLDSCDISISRDNRFIAVSIRGDDGERRLVLLALNGEPVPKLSVEHVRFGVFVDECLVLAGDNPKPLRAVKVDTWTDIPITNYVPIFNLENIASEPDGSFVAASGGGIHKFRYDPEKQELMGTGGTSLGGAPWVDWVPTRDSILSAPFNCVGPRCRFFPSSSNYQSGSAYMFASSEEFVGKLGSGRWPSE